MEQRKEVIHCIGNLLKAMHFSSSLVLMNGCVLRRLQIEELEARVALMPLLQAEHDRR
jgi:hypothetical protein